MAAILLGAYLLNWKETFIAVKGAKYTTCIHKSRYVKVLRRKSKTVNYTDLDSLLLSLVIKI